MRIAHISDLHLRNFKYRDEYATAFSNLKRKLIELKPDLIINTGDTVHSKLAVSPELIDDVAGHMRQMADIAPYWLILGNHDLNLKNKGRSDAISPIVRALRGSTKHEVTLLDDGPGWGPNTAYWWEKAGDEASKDFWHFDIRGRRNPSKFQIDPSRISIGLFHGSISGCVTDSGFTLDEGEAELSKFDQMDFVLMGDIHQRQSFRDGRVRYPGSLIQQNYGEELVKGFLLWDIRGKNDFDCDFHEIEAPGRFHTIEVAEDLDISKVVVPMGSHIRAIVKGELSPSKRWELEKRIFEEFEPIDVITADESISKSSVVAPTIDDLVGSRDQLMRDLLTKGGTDPLLVESVVNLFGEYEKGLEEDVTARGSTWQLQKVAWDNMLNYGEGNSLDLTKLSGIVGIFAPNASGKSSIFDILLQALFDKISKEVPRNIDVVNDNKDSATMLVEFESGGQPFTIERIIERIHYGQRKLAEVKQWGKTSLEFSSVDESLNGTSRPETERAIRQIIGSFEDFALTTMVTQNPIFGIPGGGDIINCKETDRRKILFRFLDLDVYERVANAAKDDLKVLMGKLKGLDRDKLQVKLDSLNKERAAREASIQDRQAKAREVQVDLDETIRLLNESTSFSVIELMAKKTRLEDALASNKRRIEADEMGLVNATNDIAAFAREYDAHLTSKPVGLPDLGIGEIIGKLEEKRLDLQRTSERISNSQLRRREGISNLKVLDSVPCGTQYPSCHFIEKAHLYKLQEPSLDSLLEIDEQWKASLATELETLEGYVAMDRQVVEWERRLNGIHSMLESAKRDESTTRTLVTTHKSDSRQMQRELADVQDALEVADVDKIKNLTFRKGILADAVELSRQDSHAELRLIGGLDSQIYKIEEDIEGLNGLQEQITIYEALIKTCGKDGIPYRILTMVLPLINVEIEKILTGIVKFNVFFEDDPAEQTVSLFIRYGDFKSRPLSLGSGAEKFIASLAIRVALLGVSTLPKTDILIIDEGFGKLDPERLEALQRMFEYLKGAFGTVFIVSHVDSLRDVVDHTLEITSQDGYAHVEVS